MLDRARDAQRDVQLRRHGLAGLTDLELARVVARVDSGTRGADSGTERVGELLDDGELLGASDATTTGDDDRCLGELRTVATDVRLDLGDLHATLLRRNLDVDALARSSLRCGLDATGAHGEDRGVALGLRVDGERTTEDRVDADSAFLDVDDVGEHARAETHGKTACDLLAVGVGRDEDARGRCLLSDRRQDVDLGADQVVGRVVGLGDVDLLGTGGLEVVDDAVGATGCADHDGRRRTECTSGGDQFVGHLLEGALGVLLDQNEYFCHCFAPGCLVACGESADRAGR